MATLASPFLIGPSPVLRVRRIVIKAWMSLNFNPIRQLTVELAVLEHLKKQCLAFVLVAIDLILFKLEDNEEMHNILDVFEFRPDWTTDNRVSCH